MKYNSTLNHWNVLSFGQMDYEFSKSEWASKYYSTLRRKKFLSCRNQERDWRHEAIPNSFRSPHLNLCTNATGSHALPISIIGSAKQPRAFGLRPYHVHCLISPQKKAWKDGEISRSWFHNVFLPQVRSRTTAEIALVLHNASAQRGFYARPNRPREDCLPPPNCTSVHQRMDCGLIAAVKIKSPTWFLRKLWT